MQLWKLKRHIHVSWCIALLCGGVIAGVMAAVVIPTFFSAISWLIAALSLAAFCLWRRKVYVIPLLVVAGFIVGCWRGSIVQAELAPYQNLVGHMVTIEGRVSEDPEKDKGGSLIVRLTTERVDGRSLGGMIWLTTSDKREIKRGDTIIIQGVLEAGFGSFSGSMFRAKVEAVKRPVPGDVAGRVREWFSGQVQKVISAPESALGIGFLTGQRQELSAELEEALKIAGLTHIVVASGYNLTILVRLGRRLFARISKYLAALSGVALIGGFLAITGMSPSMSRAGLVAGLSLAAWYYGRKFHPLVLLPFVAAVTLIINPSYGWNDLGWQLSFAAFAGVMILAPLLQRYFFGEKEPGIMRQVFGETMSAQLATFPIVIVAFGQISNVALFTNMLIVPLIPFAMLLTFSAGITAIIPWMGGAVGWIAQTLLAYMVGVTQFFAGLPWALSSFSVPVWVGGVMYGVLIGIGVYLWRVTRYDLRDANIVE